MKKVLFTATVDSHILHFHLPYLKYFKEQGYEVHVATNGNQEIPYCDKKYIIPFEKSPYKTSNIKAIIKLKKIIMEEKYDIIHTHTPMGSVVTRIAAKKTRKKYNTKVLYTAHGFHFYKGAPKLNWLLFYPIEKYLSRYTDTLITINKEDYDLAKKKFHCRIEYVVGVGIDEEKFKFEMPEQEKLELRQSLGLTKDDFVLIFPAELNKNKNQKFLLEAMKELIKKDNKIHLLLPGVDSYNGYYQKLAKEYGLDQNIHFLSYRNDIPNLLKVSNLAISSSLREGLPVNVIEAFASSIPVVALNCRGLNDLLVNNRNGYIINSLEELVEKITLFYKNRKLLDELGKNAYIDFDNYKLSKILEVMKKIYFCKKKILHLLTSNSYSGAENVACTIINYMSDNYEMAYCSPNGKIKKTLKEKGIFYIPLNKLSYAEVKRIIKEYKPDVIHAHDNRAGVLSALCGRNYKIISHIHGNNIIMNSFNLKSFLYKMASKRFSRIIWVSDSSLNDYYFKNNIRDKSIVLYNVIDKNEIIKKSNEYECKDEYDLIFLGRLAYPKNPERLIELMRLLKEKKSDITLAIVGDGVDKEKVKKLVYDYNLENNVDFYGFQSNPFPILKKSKILIMTSIYEGTPMCALEALSLGKPIVATPVDGLKRIISNKKNGYLSFDNNDICDNIICFLKEPNYYKIHLDTKEMFDSINNYSNYYSTIDQIYKNAGGMNEK